MDWGHLRDRLVRGRSYAVDVLARGNEAVERLEQWEPFRRRYRQSAGAVRQSAEPKRIGPAGWDPDWDAVRDRRDFPYYDRQGNPISLRQWATLSEDIGYNGKRVAESDIVTAGGLRVWVSTVWLGLDHGFYPGGDPVIFETMAFPGESGGNFTPRDLDCNRYTSLEQAYRGHQEMAGQFAQDWWLDLGGRA